MNTPYNELTGLEIAIIGMAAQLPGAETVEQFWHNLCQGEESLTTFSDEQLQAVGVPTALLQNPHYIKAKGYLENGETFDNTFFDFSTAQAKAMDPQLRLLHMCAWHALENAGYNPHTAADTIGVYTGASYNIPWVNALLNQDESPQEIYNLLNLNDLGSFATMLAYKLNLRGPSISVQTACSTSLVAVHLAVQALLNGDCDMALAGGVSLTYPLVDGYLAQEGMIHSPTGHCRAFDAQADGTLAGNGAGIVVLKPLENALADRDHIVAIIKGTAVNNDGQRKVGYTAPSIKGQMEVIRAAHLAAEIDPTSISYIEAHGTGTNLGDPVEIAGLKQAFAHNMPTSCALGSVKTNIGHLDVAAGITGLIKTALCLQHKTLVPSLHFRNLNPNIDLNDTPFYINTTLKAWTTDQQPLRAGVSSFGIGGTNAHIILEAFEPEPAAKAPAQPVLLTLSAHTEGAFQSNAHNLAHFLQATPEVNLADVAFTLNSGRRLLPYRAFVVGTDTAEVKAQLQQLSATILPPSPQHTFHLHLHPPTEPFCQRMQDLYNHHPHYQHLVDETLVSLPMTIQQALKTAWQRHTITDPLVAYSLQYNLARLLLSHLTLPPTAVSGEGPALFYRRQPEWAHKPSRCPNTHQGPRDSHILSPSCPLSSSAT